MCTICASSVVAADALGAHEEAAGRIERAAGHFVADAFLDGHGFAGDHRLIDLGLSVEHHTIDRNFLAGPHAKLVAQLHLDSRGTSFVPRPRKTRWAVGGARSSKRAEGAAGSAARAQFEHLAEQDEHDDHGRRLEVDAELAVRRVKEGGKKPGASMATALYK